MDRGLETSAAQIQSSISKLGFALSDVRILINTQAHVDHAAGLAAVKRITKARLLASPGDAPALASGGRDDAAFGNSLTFAPVRVDELLHDGQRVSLGGVTITAQFTLGLQQGNDDLDDDCGRGWT